MYTRLTSVFLITRSPNFLLKQKTYIEKLIHAMNFLSQRRETGVYELLTAIINLSILACQYSLHSTRAWAQTITFSLSGKKNIKGLHSLITFSIYSHHHFKSRSSFPDYLNYCYFKALVWLFQYLGHLHLFPLSACFFSLGCKLHIEHCLWKTWRLWVCHLLQWGFTLSLDRRVGWRSMPCSQPRTEPGLRLVQVTGPFTSLLQIPGHIPS